MPRKRRKKVVRLNLEFEPETYESILRVKKLLGAATATEAIRRSVKLTESTLTDSRVKQAFVILA